MSEPTHNQTTQVDTSGKPESLLSRRHALSFFAGAAAATGFSAITQGQVPGGPPPGEGPPAGDTRATVINAKLEKVTDNVYAYIQQAGAGQSERSVANGGLLVCGNSLIAIDSLAAPLQAQRFIAEAEKATGKKFRRVIITHHHFDHTLATQYFGDVDVLAHEQCRALMISNDTAKPLKDLWAARENWAKGDERFQQVLPNITYKDQMSLYDGAREIRLMHSGNGHTAGDTMVYLPKEKVLFAGDLAFFVITPMSSNGYFGEWLKKIDEVLAMDIDRIVPGHGPVGGKDELRKMRGYMQHVYNEARKLFDAGVPVAAAPGKIDLGPYASWPEVGFRTRINVGRMYAEFDGSIKP